MAKIVKSADAPEGDVRVTTGSVEFKLTDAEGYETTEIAAIEAAEAHPFLNVEYTDRPEIKEAAKAQTREIREHAKAEAKVHKLNAEKDQLDPAITVDEYLEDHEKPADKAKKETK